SPPRGSLKRYLIGHGLCETEGVPYVTAAHIPPNHECSYLVGPCHVGPAPPRARVGPDRAPPTPAGRRRASPEGRHAGPTRSCTARVQWASWILASLWLVSLVRKGRERDATSNACKSDHIRPRPGGCRVARGSGRDVQP